MKVALLDRDGTVIVEPPDLRVDEIEKIKSFDDSISALKYLADNGFSVIFATNQAGIEEGRLTEDKFWQIHKEVLIHFHTIDNIDIATFYPVLYLLSLVLFLPFLYIHI